MKSTLGKLDEIDSKTRENNALAFSTNSLTSNFIQTNSYQTNESVFSKLSNLKNRTVKILNIYSALFPKK